jgi:hypothetical protein
MTTQTKEQALEILEKAHVETIRRSNTTWEPIVSIEKQLSYAIASLKQENDRSRLKEIMFHQYAVHEFDIQDTEYAESLHMASSIVDLMLEEKL